MGGMNASACRMMTRRPCRDNYQFLEGPWRRYVPTARILNSLIRKRAFVPSLLLEGFVPMWMIIGVQWACGAMSGTRLWRRSRFAVPVLVLPADGHGLVGAFRPERERPNRPCGRPHLVYLVRAGHEFFRGTEPAENVVGGPL